MTVPSRRQRSIPFLQRNVLQGMGNTQSSAQKAGDAPNDNDKRATKRRRLDTTKTPAHVLADQLFHAREVSDAQHSLVIQVHRIFHRDSMRVSISTASCEDSIKLRARCKITLTHFSHDREVTLYCNSKMCEIKSFKDPGGPWRMARVYLPQPFHIPKDCMRVNRDHDNSFDLADAYRLCVDVEAAGPTYWPPITLNASGEEIPRSRKAETLDWVLHAATSDLIPKKPSVSKRPSSLSLKVKKSPSSCALTDYLIEVDTQWTTAFEASAFRRLEDGVKPSITVRAEGAVDDPLPNPPLVDSPPGTPVRGQKNGIETPVKGLKNVLVNGDHDEDELEEELTPNRSLRVRGATKNYNLKVLSDKAQGKEKKRKKRRNANAVEDGSVVYKLPREQVSLDSFRCITCGIPHASLPQLQAHLISQHAEYEYKPLRRGAEFEVTHRFELYSFDAEPFSFQRPVKAYDLDQFAEGNISLLTSQSGPEDDAALLSRTQARGKQTTKQATAKSSQARSKFIVPDIKQTLYDPISRATLQPGTEYSNPEPNDQWLIQWHRDALADFSDVPPSETEYMQEWDQFMLTKRISSSCYFPRAWMGFVELKADWLLSSTTHMVEFGKHLTYLLARNSLDHNTVDEALQHIAACRTKLGIINGHNPTPLPKESPKGPHVRKSASGCQVCGITVLGPRLLLCANAKCAKRLYHSDCISENARMSVEDPDWVCNQCFGEPAAERTS